MARFSQHLGVPMNLNPRFFPVAGDPAARLIIAVDQNDGAPAAMKLAGAVFTAVWAQERDITNAAVLAQLLAECGLPEGRVAQSQADEVDAAYQRYTREAIDAGGFGAPTYVIGTDVYWGQDRLDFVERALHSGAGAH